MSSEIFWMGLHSYGENDVLYGRDNEKVELEYIVENSVLTTVFGKSGIGKSSLISAGVFPILRKNDYFPVYVKLNHNVDESYSEQIIERIEEESEKYKFNVNKSGKADENSKTIADYLTSVSFNDKDYNMPQSLVIALDQFEEIFTLPDREHTGYVESFFSDLSDVLKSQFSQFRIVVIIREDYLYCLECKSVIIPALKRNRYCLKALNKEQATEIITKPCPGLVSVDVAEHILAKVSSKNSDEYEPAILSLFMFSLYEKMKSSRSDVISNELVDTFGDNIIIDFYNSSTQNISDSSMEFIEEHLLTDGGYRHNIPVDDAHNHGVTDVEIKQLVDNRIVTESKVNNMDYMEFSHDVLCAVATKSRNERRLRIQKKKNRRRMRIMAGVIGSILLVLGVIGVLLYDNVQQKKELNSKNNELEETNAELVENQRELALSKSNEESKNRELELKNSALEENQRKLDSINKELRLKNEEIKKSKERLSKNNEELLKRQQAMLRMQTQATVEVVKQNMERPAVCIAALLEVLPDSIEKPNRPYLIEPIRLLHKLYDGRLLNVWRHVYAASFSSGNRYVVTASNNSTARIWDVATGNPVGEPMCHDKSVESATFSPDCRYVVTTSGNIARIWDVATGKPVGEQMRHEDKVNTANFSPDGHYVVTVSRDNTARIWDATGNRVGEPMHHEDKVNTVNFSSNSHYVVTASLDNTARIWDATGNPVGKPMRHDSWVNTASFSPDGLYVVTASYDKTARVWDTMGKPVGGPMHHEYTVNTVNFSPDGRYVITASSDNTARIWNTMGNPVGEPMYHKDKVNTANFSPDGRYVVTASSDNTARIWDTMGKPVGGPMLHDNHVMSASFSSDGRYVVTASDDNTARVWNATIMNPDGEQLKQEETVRIASFSPDGRYEVRTSSVNTARLWDIATGKPVGEPMVHKNYINTASFSPDGRYVVTASNDKTARIWNATTGKPVGEPMRHDSLVKAASFSPNSRYVLTASKDNTVRIWDVTSNECVYEYDGDYINIYPDMKNIAIEKGKEVIIKPFLEPQELITKCRKVYKNFKLTPEERRKYYLE